LDNCQESLYDARSAKRSITFVAHLVSKETSNRQVLKSFPA